MFWLWTRLRRNKLPATLFGPNVMSLLIPVLMVVKCVAYQVRHIGTMLILDLAEDGAGVSFSLMVQFYGSDVGSGSKKDVVVLMCTSISCLGGVGVWRRGGWSWKEPLGSSHGSRTIGGCIPSRYRGGLVDHRLCTVKPKELGGNLGELGFWRRCSRQVVP
jgi:hypothetical protein